MTERVGPKSDPSEATKDRLKGVLDVAATGVTAALTVGVAAIPASLARGWLSKQAINVGAGVLARTLDK